VVDAIVGVGVVVDVGRVVVVDEGLRSHGFGGDACMSELRVEGEERPVNTARTDPIAYDLLLLRECLQYIVAAQGASPRLLQKFFVLFGTCTIWHLLVELARL